MSRSPPPAAQGEHGAACGGTRTSILSSSDRRGDPDASTCVAAATQREAAHVLRPPWVLQVHVPRVCCSAVPDGALGPWCNRRAVLERGRAHLVVPSMPVQYNAGQGALVVKHSEVTLARTVGTGRGTQVLRVKSSTGGCSQKGL